MSTSEPTLDRPVLRYFEGRCADWAVTALQTYCHGTTRASGRPLYTGACFEALAAREQPDAFTASDLVAVSMLSVTVPPRAAIRLLVDKEPTRSSGRSGPTGRSGRPRSRTWRTVRTRHGSGSSFEVSRTSGR